MADQKRWSDEKLQQFYDEFNDHVKSEATEHERLHDLYDAVFRKADQDTNTPPGMLQMMGQLNTQLKDMRIWQDRQKTFVGGVIFACTSVWFLLSEAGPKLLFAIKKLVS